MLYSNLALFHGDVHYGCARHLLLPVYASHLANVACASDGFAVGARARLYQGCSQVASDSPLGPSPL